MWPSFANNIVVTMTLIGRILSYTRVVGFQINNKLGCQKSYHSINDKLCLNTIAVLSWHKSMCFYMVTMHTWWLAVSSWYTIEIFEFSSRIPQNIEWHLWLWLTIAGNFVMQWQMAYFLCCYMIRKHGNMLYSTANSTWCAAAFLNCPKS